MEREYTILIFFNTERLGRRRFQLQAREGLLSEGIARLQREVPFVRLLAPNVSSCAVTAQVAGGYVPDFVAYLDQNSEWVNYEFDGTNLLKAAKQSARDG